MATLAHSTVQDTFTPGRSPTITYNPRSQFGLEDEIRSYLRAPGQALVVSGPTKSGKTVLVERVLGRDNAIWIDGADLTTVDDIWDAVVDFLGLYSEIGVQSDTSSGRSGSITGSASIGAASVGASIGADKQKGSTVSHSASRPKSRIAREALQTLTHAAIVIDDFHYVPQGIKTDVVRAIKGIVPSSPVVLIAVPQDAFDAVRAENDMVGRIRQLQITPWTVDELAYIGAQGFSALNLSDPHGDLTGELAANSLGAPYLMQELCFRYCVQAGVNETLALTRLALRPQPIEDFYEAVAVSIVPGLFESLRTGPKTKGQPRKTRKLKTENETDIYGLILYAISQMGPLSLITLPQLMYKVNELVKPDFAPNSQGVSSALNHMLKIAKDDRRNGDLAIDYKDDKIYIADPFLSFYLRFGAWDLPSPPHNAI